VRSYSGRKEGRATGKPTSGLRCLVAGLLDGRGRRARAEEVPAGGEGQAPVIGPRIIIKPERHPPGAGLDAPMDLGVVGGGGSRSAYYVGYECTSGPLFDSHDLMSAKILMLGLLLRRP